MILAIDMGNSNIVVGGIDDKRTYFEERITTDDRKTSLEYAIMLKNILEIHRVKRGEIEGSIMLLRGAAPKCPSFLCRKENHRQAPSFGRLRHENRTEHQDGQPQGRRR